MSNANPSGSSRKLSILGILAGTMAGARRLISNPGEAARHAAAEIDLAKMDSSAVGIGHGSPPRNAGHPAALFGQSRECAKLRRKSRLRAAGIGGQRQ